MAELKYIRCDKCNAAITVASMRKDGLCSACKCSREFYVPYPGWTPGFFRKTLAHLRERLNR